MILEKQRKIELINFIYNLLLHLLILEKIFNICTAGAVFRRTIVRLRRTFFDFSVSLRYKKAGV